MTMKIYTPFLFCFILLLTSCSKKTISTTAAEIEAIESKEEAVSYHSVLAKRLAQNYILTDGHVDLPYRLKVMNFRLTKEFIGIPVESEKGEFDYKRSREGGLDAPFMSIYVPARLQTEAGASKLMADTLIDMVKGIAEAHPENFQVVTRPSQIIENHKKGIVSLPLGMENGSPIEDDINNVAYFRKRGISYITLTHSLNNQICDSSYDTTRLWNGLSEFGEKVVRHMNKEGILVDISHVSDSTFYDVMNLTRIPVIASHSSCRKFTPGFERNMSDDMLKALAKNNGVIMINFGSTFIDGDIKAKQMELGVQYRAELKENGWEHGDKNAEALGDKYFKNNPILWSNVEVVVDHIEHVIKVAGINHVGFGSDFDGVGDTLPTGIKDVSDYPNIIKELLDRGYSESDIEKICSGNLFRVWNEVLTAAASSHE